MSTTPRSVRLRVSFEYENSSFESIADEERDLKEVLYRTPFNATVIKLRVSVVKPRPRPRRKVKR